jgi:hypothetical protein
MGMDIRALTTLLYSRALARVLKCVFVFGATPPFAYTQSVTLSSERTKSARTIWPRLLVRFGMVSSRSTCASLRNTIFHIDGKREMDLVSFYRSGGREDDSFENEKRGLQNFLGGLVPVVENQSFARTTFKPTMEHGLRQLTLSVVSIL